MSTAETADARSIVREFYEAHARTCPPEDFFGQVKRTVNGQPVPELQIDLIVSAVRSALALDRGDLLLDLCCGNGALTTRFFAGCAGGLGVDFAPTLIDAAREHFVRRNTEAFHLQDVMAFLRTGDAARRFTKAVCYGGFQCLPEPDAVDFLALLHDRFKGIELVLLGSLPDKDRIDLFFGERVRPAGIEASPVSPLGIWRTEAEIRAMATAAGWTVEIRRMPAEFYAAHYRYDVLLGR